MRGSSSAPADPVSTPHRSSATRLLLAGGGLLALATVVAIVLGQPWVLSMGILLGGAVALADIALLSRAAERAISGAASGNEGLPPTLVFALVFKMVLLAAPLAGGVLFLGLSPFGLLIGVTAVLPALFVGPLTDLHGGQQPAQA